MDPKSLPSRFTLTLTQLALLGLAALGVWVFIDWSRTSFDRESLHLIELTFAAEVSAESTRQVELQATLTYVQGELYPNEVLHNEGGLVLPGERVIIPNLVQSTPEAPPPVPPTPDPLVNARPWQMWWRLLTDAPAPTR